MSLSLYAATVPSFLQTLGAMQGLLAKAEDADPDGARLLQARLADDMLPFAWQMRSTTVHSLRAIEGVRAGTFSPDRSPPPQDYAGLRALVGDTVATLTAIDPAEIDGFVGRDTEFAMGELRIDFTAESFLLSFALPNFYFYATTAYGILRANGVELGKRDYLGQLCIKT